LINNYLFHLNYYFNSSIEGKIHTTCEHDISYVEILALNIKFVVKLEGKVLQDIQKMNRKMPFNMCYEDRFTNHKCKHLIILECEVAI